MCRHRSDLEVAGWPLPDGSLRCKDRAACARRVSDIVSAHKELRDLCDGDEADRLFLEEGRP